MFTIYDKEGLVIGVFNTLEEAMEAAREYALSNA